MEYAPNPPNTNSTSQTETNQLVLNANQLTGSQLSQPFLSNGLKAHSTKNMVQHFTEWASNPPSANEQGFI